MQRYLAFTGEQYYPSQGMGDFVGDFAKLEDAVDKLTEKNRTQKAWEDDRSWALVWDSETRSNAWDAWMLPEA